MKRKITTTTVYLLLFVAALLFLNEPFLSIYPQFSGNGYGFALLLFGIWFCLIVSFFWLSRYLQGNDSQSNLKVKQDT